MKALPKFIIALLISVASIAPVTSQAQTDPYEMMSAVFVGKPKKSAIQPMLEDVMKRYKLEVNRENLIRVASVLLDMRKASKIGVTEMEILKHMYQRGAKNTNFPNQAAVSATYLEIVK